jgi:hypothetical protein
MDFLALSIATKTSFSSLGISAQSLSLSSAKENFFMQN